MLTQALLTRELTLNIRQDTESTSSKWIDVELFALLSHGRMGNCLGN